jgi:hypothetical protein
VIESPKFDELKSPDSDEFISPKFAQQLASLQSKLKRKRARKIVESDSESDYDQKQRSKPLSKPSPDGPLIKRKKAETRSKEPLNYEIVEVSGDDDHGRDDGPRTEKRAIQVMDADQMRRWMAQMREDPEASKESTRLRRKVPAQSKAASVGSRRSNARSSSIASTRISVKKDLEDIMETAQRTARKF